VKKVCVPFLPLSPFFPFFDVKNGVKKEINVAEDGTIVTSAKKDDDDDEEDDGK